HELAFAPSQAHFHRYRAIDGRDDRTHDRFATVRIAQARRTAVRLGNFGSRAAEVDVDDVGATLANDFGGMRHRLRVVAPELGRDRFLEPVLVDHFHRSLAAVFERIRRNELRDGQAEAEWLIKPAHSPIRHAGHRRENERRPYLNWAYL